MESQSETEGRFTSLIAEFKQVVITSLSVSSWDVKEVLSEAVRAPQSCNQLE